MNAALTAIAEEEGAARRFMPEPPAAHHDHGSGRTEAVPLISRAFLLRCGVESLYIILSEMGAEERFGATTKERLADLILEKTKDATPARALLFPPIVPPAKAPARDKRFHRSMKRQVKDALRLARTHGEN